MLAENATATVCHSRTADLREICRQADILVAAAGKPEMIMQRTAASATGLT